MTEEQTKVCFRPVHAESGAELKLDMQSLMLRGRILAAGARLIVEHVFASAEEKPIEVIYSFQLPRDAALRRFCMRGEGFTVHSELRETKEAKAVFEKGIEDGSLSALAQQHSDGIINLTVGNIRPKETVVVRLEILAGVENSDDGFRFRFPFALAPGYHPKARMIEAEPGVGEIELPEEEFGDMVLPRFRKGEEHLHQIGFDVQVESQSGFTEITSPSHKVRMRLEDHTARLSLAHSSDIPNRDLIIAAKRKESKPEVLAGQGLDGKTHFAAIVPSTCFPSAQESPRRVVFVLDRSGSMHGLPIEQAKKSLVACLAALQQQDTFGIVAFDDSCELFREQMVSATAEMRDGAKKFLSTVDARGGTELATAITKAAQLCHGGDLFVLTDGQVFGTETILQTAKSANVRLHTLGIGSASQDRFLTLLSRDTGGVSHFASPQERVDLAALNLFASAGKTAASGVEVADSAIASSIVFQGMPLVAYGETTTDLIRIQWSGGGRLELPVTQQGRQIGETVRLLKGSRLLTDLDIQGEEGAGRRAKLSSTYGLASREMSLVAVVKREADQTGVVPVTKVVAVGMAEDTAFGSYFQSSTKLHRTGTFAAMSPMPAPMQAQATMSAPAAGGFSAGEFTRIFSKAVDAFIAPAAKAAERLKAPDANDQLMEIASSLDSDGGIPGGKGKSDIEERILYSLGALLAFLEQGSNLQQGAFRPHVSRLVQFVEASLSGAGAKRQEVIQRVLKMVKGGAKVSGSWAAKCIQRKVSWKEVDDAAHIP